MAETPSFKADPKRTYALVVGIERYDIGESWNLLGPAADAIRFVNWLLSRHVEAANIWLHMSLLNSNALPALTNPAVAVHEATREKIRGRIIDIKSVTGDLLYLFWGGHGIATTARDRRLFYADARSDDRQNLTVSGLLDHLQSERTRIKRHIAYIDSCANFTPDTHQLPLDPFPQERTNSQVLQSFFFAAAPGQKAVNDAVLQGGVFSRRVQAELDESPGFPPDPARIIATVKSYLDQSGQTGVVYESQDWIGNIRTSPGATKGPWLRYAARKLRLPLDMLEQLSSAFAGCPILKDSGKRNRLARSLEARIGRSIYRPVEVLDDAASDLLRQFTATWDLLGTDGFNQAFNPIEPKSLDSDEVSSIISRLQLLKTAQGLIDGLRNPPQLEPLLAATISQPVNGEMAVEEILGLTLNQASRELQPFYEFLRRTWNALESGDPGAPALDAFIRNNCTAQLQEKIRKTLDLEAKAMLHFLMVHTLPGKPERLKVLWVREDQRLIREPWIFDCPVQEAAVAEKVAEVLREIWRIDTFALSIEVFLLPETLHWNPDSWTRPGDFGPEKISAIHPVVVHWVKRWSEPGTAGSWSEVYQKIRSRLEACSHVWSPFVDVGEATVAAISRGLADGTCGPLLALLKAVSVKASEKPAPEVVAALKAGAPFVCWLREDPGNWKQFRGEVQALLTSPADREQFDKIPSRIFEARKAAADEPLVPPKIIAGNLTLLWDDARRSPFENRYRLPV